MVTFLLLLLYFWFLSMVSFLDIAVLDAYRQPFAPNMPYDVSSATVSQKTKLPSEIGSMSNRSDVFGVAASG